MPPTVLLVGNFLPGPAGASTLGHELGRRLTMAGWHVITTSARRTRVERLGDMLATAHRRRREYAVAQVDVFSGAAFIWAEAVCEVLGLLGKPFVLTLHGGDLPRFARRWPSRVGRLLRRAVEVTTPSRYLQEEMRRVRSDLRLLPNGLDLQVYEFRLRQRPGPSLVWLRAFHRIYNPELAAAVLAAVGREALGAHLTMVGPDLGDGSLERTLRLARELQVSECLTVVGGVPKAEVPRWLGHADLFLNTSNIDNTPVSVLEAMASGLCVVSTRAGGIPYLLESERDALLVPCNDAAAMTAAVQRLLAEPDLAVRLSHCARAKVERFDWPRVLPQWTELLSLAARRTH